MSGFRKGFHFNIEKQFRLELLRQEKEEIDSKDDDATLSNNDTDDDEFSLDIENGEEYGDPFQQKSNSED